VCFEELIENPIDIGLGRQPKPLIIRSLLTHFGGRIRTSGEHPKLVGLHGFEPRTAPFSHTTIWGVLYR
jgi:hypothetical protein